MRNRGWITLMLAAALAVACSDQKAPTGPDELAAVPELNFMNGPDEPGNGVVRRIQMGEGSDVWAFWVRDWETDLTAWAATDPDGWCDKGLSERPVDLQQGGFNATAQSSDWWAEVYDATGWDGRGDYCDLIAEKSALASGRVDFRFHVAGLAEDWMVQGQLDRTDGLGKAHLRMQLGYQYGPKPPYPIIGYKNLIVHLGPDPRD